MSGRARLALAVLALAAAGCGAGAERAANEGSAERVPDTFCGAVAALNASSLGTPMAIDENSSEEEVRRFSTTVREAADRHIALLDQLERTAPEDLRTDVALVAELGREFARTMVTLDVAGVTGRVLSDVDRAQRTFRAYQVVRAATKERCGVALDLEDGLPPPPAEAPAGPGAAAVPPPTRGSPPTRRVPPPRHVPPAQPPAPPGWPAPPPG